LKNYINFAYKIIHATTKKWTFFLNKNPELQKKLLTSNRNSPFSKKSLIEKQAPIFDESFAFLKRAAMAGIIFTFKKNAKEEAEESEDKQDKVKVNLKSQLFQACREGDCNAIEKLVAGEHSEYILLLIKNQEVLHAAVKSNDTPEILICLINNGARIDKLDGYKWTVFHWAAYENKTKILEYLCNKYPTEIYNKTGRGWFNGEESLIHCSIRGEDLEALAFIIERKYFTLEVTDQNGTPPLHQAIKQRSFNLVRFLINRDANVYLKDRDGETALHAIAEIGEYSLLKEILERLNRTQELNLCIRTNDGSSLLHKAVKSQSMDCVDLLIDTYGIDINATNIYGKTAFDPAADDEPDEIAFKKAIQATKFFQFAEAYFQKKQYDLARNYAEWIVNNASEECISKIKKIRSHFILGEIYYRKGYYIESEKQFVAVINIDADNKSAHQNLASLYFDMGNYQKAIVELNLIISCTKNETDDFSFVYKRAFSYKYLGKYNEAIDDFKTFLLAKPGDEKKFEVLLLLSECFLAINNLEKAEQVLRDAENYVEKAKHELDAHGKDNNVAEKNLAKYLQRLQNIKENKGIPEIVGHFEREIRETYRAIYQELQSKTLPSSLSPLLLKLEGYFRSRKVLSHEEFDSIANYCAKNFDAALGSDVNDQNLIDNCIEKILDFDFIKSIGKYDSMRSIRIELKHKILQHLRETDYIMLSGKEYSHIYRDGDMHYFQVGINESQVGESIYAPYLHAYRIRAWFSIYIRVKKEVLPINGLIPKDLQNDFNVKEKIKNELLEKMKKEILLSTEMFRSYRDASYVAEILKIKGERKHKTASFFPHIDALLNAHISNVKDKINRTCSGEEYVYFTGYPGHAIYTSFLRGDNNKLSIRVDNLGDGIELSSRDQITQYRHLRIKGKEQEDLFYPCLISEDILRHKMYLDDYLKNLHQCKSTQKSRDWYDKIYPSPCEVTADRFPWKPQQKQTVKNCVSANYNVGFKIRLGEAYYDWVLKQELNMAGNPDKYPDCAMSPTPDNSPMLN